MAVMRAAAVALAAGVLHIATGCGNSTASTASPTQEAAAPVPPSALAFTSADADVVFNQERTL